MSESMAELYNNFLIIKASKTSLLMNSDWIFLEKYHMTDLYIW
jgi:hypothetical protein